MSFYMFSGRYSQPAIKALVDEPQDREAAARKMIEATGGKLHHLFFAFGEDDVIAIIEAPDDAAMAAGALVIAASGAFSGGKTTHLLTPSEAKAAMEGAKKASGAYVPPTG